MTDEQQADEELATRVENVLLTVLAEADYDVDAALARMGGKNPEAGLRNRTLRELFEAMKDARENMQ
jgi:hypothetical protein